MVTSTGSRFPCALMLIISIIRHLCLNTAATSMMTQMRRWSLGGNNLVAYTYITRCNENFITVLALCVKRFQEGKYRRSIGPLVVSLSAVLFVAGIATASAPRRERIAIIMQISTICTGSSAKISRLEVRLADSW